MPMIRSKMPHADLKRTYRRVFWRCTGLSFGCHVLVAVLFPTYEVGSAIARPDQQVVQMEDIPETHQRERPPPPPRPAVPVETESEEVPDDVTIESTDLDFDEAPLDLPPPPPPGSRTADAPPEEEEIVEFWAVEKKPELLRRVYPKYPPVAWEAGLEGTVFVSFTVDAGGRVRDPHVVKGPEVFRREALEALRQYAFRPAYQNDRAVSVRMTLRIKFEFAK